MSAKAQKKKEVIAHNGIDRSYFERENCSSLQISGEIIFLTLSMKTGRGSEEWILIEKNLTR
jgi:hypothetical protein